MKKLISLLLVLAMVFSLCACGAKETAPEVTEAPLEEAAPSAPEPATVAAEHFLAGEYAEAYAILADIESDSVAELKALCLYYGYGTEAEPEAAVEILEPLAESGSCIANYLMGKASSTGNGAVQNPEKANAFFEAAIKAADSVSADSPLYGSMLFAMANCYANGLGVERDAELASVKAAEAAEAKLSVFESFELAELLRDSANTRSNMAESTMDEHGFKDVEEVKLKLEERKLAVEAPEANPGLAPADEEQLAQYLLDIETYEKIISNLDMAAQEQAMADKLYDNVKSGIKALADEGNIIAVKYMGDYNFGGLGSSTLDYEKAMDYYLQAADFDYAPAQAQIGLMYQDGLGVDVSYEQAMEWNNRAAQQGNAQGQAQIGYLYHMGLGVTQNLDEAGRWYSRAADQGDAWAAAKLAETELTNPQLAFEFHA